MNMNLKNTFLVALKAIIVNKGRAFITMLGVIIGVSSVVLLTSIGTGLQAYITEEFESLWSNNVIVFPGDVFGEGGGFDRDSQINAIGNNKLRLSDVTDIERLREYVDFAVPFNSQGDTASYRGETENISVINTTYRYEDMLNIRAAKGRFFDKTEDQSKERVTVLGWDIADKLFGKIDPIGKNIKLGTQTFKVVGVAEKQGGTFGGPSFDTYVYIPLETGFDLYDSQTILEIVVKIKDQNQIHPAIGAIEEVLLKRLDDDEFSVFDKTEILNTITSILGVLTAALGGIAAISLLVGGIGIMNIMLVSVTERTREIGLRKAIGATRRDILLQFLVEATMLSLLGGVVGVVVGSSLSLVINQFITTEINAWY